MDVHEIRYYNLSTKEDHRKLDGNHTCVPYLDKINTFYTHLKNIQTMVIVNLTTMYHVSLWKILYLETSVVSEYLNVIEL